MTVHRLITAAECHKRTNETPSVHMEHMVTSTICYGYCFSRPSDKIYVNVFCLQSINILIEKKTLKM